MNAVNKWFVFADEDWLMAKRAMESGIWNQVCFHAHQCVEKLLKGISSESKKRIIKTHSLPELLNTAVAFRPELKEVEDDCIKLDRYYIPTRYPDALPGTLPDGLPNKSDALNAMEILDRVNNLIRSSNK